MKFYEPPKRDWLDDITALVNHLTTGRIISIKTLSRMSTADLIVIHDILLQAKACREMLLGEQGSNRSYYNESNI